MFDVNIFTLGAIPKTISIVILLKDLTKNSGNVIECLRQIMWLMVLPPGGCRLMVQYRGY